MNRLVPSVAAAIGLLVACAPAPENGGVGDGVTAQPSPAGSATPELSEPPSAQPDASTPAASPPVPDPAQDPLLIDAAAQGDAGAVAAALAAGASVLATDNTGRTALVAAAYGNHLEAARVLLQAGSDVNHKDTTQQSAYLLATSEVGPDPALLRLTMDHGADLTSLDSFRGTGLIRAADRGYAQICGILIDAGIAVNHVNRLGWTALHEAIILGDGGPAYQETVAVLIDGGADVNLPSGRDGIRPLQHATSRGYDAIAHQLRAAGAA